MALREFKLPDPGEGLTEADIVTWHVAVGDTVRVNDVVVEIETAKSLVELPVPFAGTVSALHVAEGDTVEVGTPIITIDDGVGGASAPAAATPVPESTVRSQEAPGAPAAAPEAEIAEGLIGGTTSTGRTAVLVGYGVKQTEAKRRPRKGERTPEPTPAPVPGPSDGSRQGPEPSSPGAASGRPLAKPPVRKLAKDLGVDLSAVTPTGEGGIVTRSDVEAAAAGGTGAPAPGPAAGGETRIPVKGVRRMTAQAMVASAFTAPHVTEWVTVDVTATMDLVEKLKRDKEFRDVKVTPLLVLAKAMCVVARRHPDINASWDEAAQEIVLKHDVNLGIAAATPRGLVVPNVKAADRMTMRELAEAIGALTATAREGRTPPADMAGGTITITNVGVFGVDAGTPILNPGEAAILAFGSVTRRPWVVGTGADERIEPRWVTTLALSFDHRLVDGELGSRFLADVAAVLADPARGLVWG
ncbi:dihydrolipoamide acetyltransferase family protein [Phycicoccus duodecadis]|uniref:Dihydrolipoamide acetyltransferase component of pyruvate dehydrogenase complex n=1 Tax=Phycicoccus duodecadis TaxID=173053 RepID=A0A2N3YJ60_9MICO|nr:dihydrolipoamide acetyltransferase family protein [Phycicoccus duodecadis]PKW26885.1 pyruvate dehydrogenase E2 component (dihydrolipoamide acetyltransferase) [Phycicoccus duodecadis]